MMILLRQDAKRLFVRVLVCCFITAFFTTEALAFETRGVKLLYQLDEADGTALSLPTDVCVGPKGQIYIVDSGNDRVLGFSADGAHRLTIGAPGTALTLRSPTGLTVDHEGRMYIADSNNHRVLIVAPTGKQLGEIRLEANGKALKPIDVAVGREDSPSGIRIYVSENTTHSVRLYDAQGLAISIIGKKGSNPGEFRYPATLAVSDDGTLNIVDVLNTRVQRFLPNGERIAQVGNWGVTPGRLFRPKGVAIDSKGNIYISDSYLEVIQVFTPSARFRYLLGRKGQPFRFPTVTGIAVRGGRLYVAETRLNRVSVYELGE